jgi:hypothetical protein
MSASNAEIILENSEDFITAPYSFPNNVENRLRAAQDWPRRACNFSPMAYNSARGVKEAAHTRRLLKGLFSPGPPKP